MGEEGWHLGQGVDSFGHYCNWAQCLGGQGQDIWGWEPILFGEDGVNTWRVEDNLQTKGTAGGQFVNVLYFEINIIIKTYSKAF